MTHKAFFKGLTIGILTGAAISAAVMPAMHDKRGMSNKCAKKTGKFLRTAGEVIDHITGVFY